MKLFIWNNPYDVGYGASFAFAVAESVEEAREQILSGGWAPYGRLRSGQKTPIAAGDIARKPDRIHDLPYGEVYEWSE